MLVLHKAALAVCGGKPTDKTVLDKAMKALVLFVTALFLYQSLAAVIDIRRRPAPEAPTTYSVQTPPLDTPWTYQLGESPWSEHPRPQLQRTEWQSLNGIWKYRNATGTQESIPIREELPHEVMIPSCLESALSGIQGSHNFYSWFSRNFTVPGRWDGGRVLLNFGAVDYEATVYVGSTLSKDVHADTPRSTASLWAAIEVAMLPSLSISRTSSNTGMS